VVAASGRIDHAHEDPGGIRERGLVAEQEVVPGSGIDSVVSAAADQHVVAAAGDDAVVAAFARVSRLYQHEQPGQAIDEAIVADDKVRAVAHFNDVAALATDHGVGPTATRDGVGTVAA